MNRKWTEQNGNDDYQPKTQQNNIRPINIKSKKMQPISVDFNVNQTGLNEYSITKSWILVQSLWMWKAVWGESPASMLSTTTDSPQSCTEKHQCKWIIFVPSASLVFSKRSGLILTWPAVISDFIPVCMRIIFQHHHSNGCSLH